jgi:hypothetical protein
MKRMKDWKTEWALIVLRAIAAGIIAMIVMQLAIDVAALFSH